jgi:hypothetical protein
MKTRLLIFFFLLLFTRCLNPESIKDSPIVSNHQTLGKQFKSSIDHKDASENKISGKTPGFTNTIRSPNRKKGSGKQPYASDSIIHHGSYNAELIKRISMLRSQGITPDLTEPSNQKTLLDPTSNYPFESMIELSQEIFLQINFDNDILDYTDRFYTNGIRIDFIAPGLQMNPLSRLMLPYRRSGINYYGLSMVQNMFTPSTTKLGGILFGDRPYSAYMYLGSFKITNDPARRYRQTSELDIGIIGPDSYGEWVQRSFHNAVPTNNEPLGWEYQIKNDLVLNYSLSVEKGIVAGKNIELQFSSKGNIGTLYTNLSVGFQLRTGWMNPYFSNLGIAKKQQLKNKGLKKFQLCFFMKGKGQVIGYDATLQGGFFNKSSVYTIPASNISRLVFNGSAGVNLSFNGIGIDLEQFLLSPEYQYGSWHKWVHIALRFAL